MILFTVIIPHFNSKNKIRRLLSSIRKDDSIQIIVVDDLSTEPSIFSVRKDPSFGHVQFVFPGKKLTAGGARNVGLKHAAGEYIIFADADDYFCHDAFTIFREQVESGYDLYQFKATSFIEDSGLPGSRHLYLDERYKELGLGKYISVDQPIAKVINHALIKKKHIEFNEVPAGNDVLFSAKISLYAQTKKFVNKIVYNISQNPDSITAQTTDEYQASRLSEQIKKVELIINKTSFWFWITYLPRRNAFRLTKNIHSISKSKELHELALQYNRTMPFSTHMIFHAIQFLKRYIPN
jgi:glycosyltransferase involved in cell wall biosynthesis